MTTEITPNIYLIDAFYAYPYRGAVFLVKDDDEVALIDTGTAMSPVYIMAALKQLNIAASQVRYLLTTHVHLDHAGGAGPLTKQLPNAQVYVHPSGLRHLVDPTKLIAGGTGIYGEEMMATAIGDVVPIPAERGVAAKDGQELPLGSKHLRIVFSPGHASHHYSIWDENSGCYFAGDVAGNSYPMMNNDGKHLMFLCSAPVQYDPPAWHKSLTDMAALKPTKLCLCHYGILDNVTQAIDDMHRLIDEVGEEVLKFKSEENNYPLIEKVVWNSFWREFDRLSSPMERLHAELWMKQDVHIATAGLVHWLSQP